MISTWRNIDGSVNIGILVDAGIILAVPFIVFRTWQEYADWVTKQCNFIELEYERESTNVTIKTAVNMFVNSLVEIDKIGVTNG